MNFIIKLKTLRNPKQVTEVDFAMSTFTDHNISNSVLIFAHT